MAAGISITTEGTDQLASAMNSVGDALTREMATVLQEFGDSIVNEAQAAAPVDTGYMRDHISVTDASDTHVTIVSEADYSGFVEYGTRHMDAQPFITPALDFALSTLQARLDDAISRAIQR